MTTEQQKEAIAKAVCIRFIDMQQPTRRHSLLVTFEDPDLVAEMERSNLLAPTSQKDSYLPTSGTFALLHDDDPLYRLAHEAFSRTICGLRNLYRSEGTETRHTPEEFEIYTNKLYDTPASQGMILLGLYLVRDFGALSQWNVSDDQMTVISFHVSESIVRIKDSDQWWKQRVRSARAPMPRFGMPIGDPLTVSDEEEDAEDIVASLTDLNLDGFWALIHPLVVAAARPRAQAGYYADAIENALKSIAAEVRKRTGLALDGADLMRQTFSPKQPRLIWSDPIPDTQKSMQQGYMDIFAGVMTGIRNPKAHGMVNLSHARFIHFLFLVSLLAYKLDEAVVPPPAPAPTGA